MPDIKSRPKPRKRRPVLTEKSREIMMTILLRNKKAFETALTLLKWEHFSGVSQPMLAVWKIATEFYAANGELPPPEILAGEVSNAIEIDPGILNDPESEAVDAFLKWAFKEGSFPEIETGERYIKWAVAAAKQVMEEYLARDLKERVFARDAVPVDFPDEVMRIMQETEK